MDAGVLQLHVFPHQADEQHPKVLQEGERITPTLTGDAPIEQSAAVSLIIPTFFNKSLKNGSLRHVLGGIESSNVVKEVVLVVANDVADDEASIIPPVGDIEVVQVACEPSRRARTRNLGVETASHDVLMFLDDDMVIRDWKAIDAIASKMLVDDYDCALFPRRNYARFPLLYDEAALEQTIGQWRSQPDELAASVVFDPVQHGCAFKTMNFCFPGCFMLIRREAYEAIGGFPEEFEGWGFEDSDFAIRAVAILKVLNLFRQSDALLHVDHPVSPYKSEEYQKNFIRFLSSHSMSDMDQLCDRVVAGDNFGTGTIKSSSTAAHMTPIGRLAESGELPLADEQATLDEIRHRYEVIVESRLEKSCKPTPEHVVLHGSRGGGTSTNDSDFDLLFVFRGGNIREFFACQTGQGDRLELEFSDCGKFEALALQPVLYPLYGPFELAKLAQGKVLVGDVQQWDHWVDQQLRTAVELGRLYWFLYGVGMTLQPDKFGIVRNHFFKALSTVLEKTDSPAFEDDVAHLHDFELDRVGPHLRRELDSELGCWRDDFKHSIRLFAFQVPEVWVAMRWLIENEKS